MMAYNLDYFFDISPDPFCILDKGGVFVRVNPAFTRLLGWSWDDIQQKPFLNYADSNSVEKNTAEVAKLTHDGMAVTFENRYRCKDNTYRILRWSVTRQDEVLFCNGYDLTELSETYQLFKLLIENSPTGMVLVDQKGVIKIANRESARIFGYSKGELINQSVEILLPDQVRSHHTRIRDNYSKNPGSRPMGTGRDLLGRHKDGHQIEVEIGLNPINTGRGNFVLSTIIDLTERKRLEESMLHFTEQLEESIQELSELASTDSLTQLRNRRAFMQHFTVSLQTAAKERDQISLLLMDIDDFKGFNDSFGHPAGDSLLVEIAQILQGISRTDDFIARIGGEEFSVILPGTGRNASIQIAQRYLRKINQIHWPHRQVTVSIGAASFDFKEGYEADLQTLLDQLLQEADLALYTSKTRGKNRATHFCDRKP